MKGDAPVIAILGHYANSNHGDDACAKAMLLHLSEFVPTAQFVMICQDPNIGESRFGFPAFPVEVVPTRQIILDEEPSNYRSEEFDDDLSEPPEKSWRARARSIAPLRRAVLASRKAFGVVRNLPIEIGFIASAHKRLNDVDLLIVTGSNPIFDFFGGYWNYPYTIWKWAKLAQVTKTKLAFASVGAGPIVSARSGRLLARVLRMADYVSFRDKRSCQIMRNYGFDEQMNVFPDLAHSLTVPPRPKRTGARIRVGINPMPVHHADFWPQNDSLIQNGYIRSLAELASKLVSKGIDVFFYGTQKDDRVTAQQIQTEIRKIDSTAQVPEYIMPETIEKLTQLCLSADILVSTRYHGAVFGCLTLRPTLAICYQDKTREVLESAGLSEFAIDFEDVDIGALCAAVDSLLIRQSEIEELLKTHATKNRAALQEQYRQLVKILNATIDK